MVLLGSTRSPAWIAHRNSLGGAGWGVRAVERGAPVDCGRGETCYHLVDSPHSNEYRALRVVDPAAGKNLLFAGDFFIISG